MRSILTITAMAALLSATPVVAKWPGNSGPGNGQAGQNGNNGNSGNNGNMKNSCAGWHEDHGKAMSWYSKHHSKHYGDYME